MNTVFPKFLRKFVLVFFDDILIYSKSLAEHKQHLSLVFQTLRNHELKAKLSKCTFGQYKVDYLGHVISGQGVATDPSKIAAIANWPIPDTIKKLRSLLGFTGYYRRYIADYALICQPLYQALKKDGFHWGKEQQEAFTTLKRVMSSPPLLRLPDFSKPFYLETDACNSGLGARRQATGLLQQNSRPKSCC